MKLMFCSSLSGQDISTTEKHWGFEPGNPAPPLVSEYILIFAETDPTFGWVHHKKDDKGFPEYDLLFVDDLVNDIRLTYT